MKKTIVSTLSAALLLASIPFSASALSCMQPEMMHEDYVSGEQYTVVTATAYEESDYVTYESELYEGKTSGYHGQFLQVSSVQKGEFPTEDWVYFERDETWDYLCVGAPPEIGIESMYVIRHATSPMQLDMVVAVYPADSELAISLTDALVAAEGEGATYEFAAKNHASRIAQEIRELAHIIRIKLAEWRTWAFVE